MSTNSISEKIAELFELHKSGLLTKEEYEVLKSQVLNVGKSKPVVEENLKNEIEQSSQQEEIFFDSTVSTDTNTTQETTPVPTKENNEKTIPAGNMPVTQKKRRGKKMLITIISIVIIVIIVITAGLLIKQNDLKKKRLLAEKWVADSTRVADSVAMVQANQKREESSLHPSPQETERLTDENLYKDSTNAENISANEFIDNRDHKVYKWVKIGSQVWMAENLAYLPRVFSHYKLEFVDSIYKTATFSVWNYNGENVTEAKKTDAYREVGVCYNYVAAMNSCPQGWHLPSLEEWEELGRFVESEGLSGLSLISKKDKRVWKTGTDNYGFSANGKSTILLYWLSDETDDYNADVGGILSNGLDVRYYSKARMHNVRCIKN